MKQRVTPAGGWLQASSLLFVLTMAFNACNYIFHALVSRMLGPGEYGAFVSVLTLLTILSIPSQTIQAVIARQVAIEALSGRKEKVYSLALHASFRLFLIGMVMVFFLVMASPWISRFWHLTTAWPLHMAALTLVVMLLIPVVRGVLQGLQHFTAMGLNLLTDGVIRIVVGFLLLWLGFSTSGAVIASAIAAAVALVVGCWVMRELARQPLLPATQLPWSDIYRYTLPVLAGFGGHLFLTNLDVTLVKHFFPGAQAGYYSAAAMVGKIFHFLPLAIAQVIFPKASAGAAQAQDMTRLLHKSLLATAAVLLAGILAVWLRTDLVILTMFGRGFLNAETIMLARGCALAVTPIALAFILLQYNLAVKNMKFVMLLWLDLPVLLLLLVNFHQSLAQVLLCLGLNNLGLFAAGYAVTRVFAPNGKKLPA